MSQRAAHNLYSQGVVNTSLALFLESCNLPVPNPLTTPVVRSSRPNKRCRGDHEAIPKVRFGPFPSNSLSDVQLQSHVDQSDHNEVPVPPSTYNPPDGPNHRIPTPPLQQEPQPEECIPTDPRPSNKSNEDAVNAVVLGLKSPIDDLKKTAHFIDALQSATL